MKKAKGVEIVYKFKILKLEATTVDEKTYTIGEYAPKFLQNTLPSNGTFAVDYEITTPVAGFIIENIRKMGYITVRRNGKVVYIPWERVKEFNKSFHYEEVKKNFKYPRFGKRVYFDYETYEKVYGFPPEIVSEKEIEEFDKK